MKYYLGIDGGGTKTVAAVSDENGNILLMQEGKSINFYSVGMESARFNLETVLVEIDAVRPRMTENAVKNYSYPLFLRRFAQSRKLLFCAEKGVCFFIICRIVTVV